MLPEGKRAEAIKLKALQAEGTPGHGENFTQVDVDQAAVLA